MLTSSLPNTSKSNMALSNVDIAIREKIDQILAEDPEWQSKRRVKRKEYLQALFLYPAMMVTDGQRDLISLITGCQEGVKRLFDPYMGSASSLLAGIECGLSCYGQDINPLAVLLAQVKLSDCTAQALFQGYTQAYEYAQKHVTVAQITDFQGIDRWFKPEVIMELSRIQAGIYLVKSLEVRRFLWITFAETIRLTSNDRISTYKLHRRKEDEIARRTISPLTTFKRLAEDNIRYLAGFKRMLKAKGFLNISGEYAGEIQIAIANSQNSIEVGTKDNLFDILVTSPPYGDNKSTIPYGQHSYLPLQWIDLDDISPGLTNHVIQSTHQIDYQSIGGSERPISLEDNAHLFQMSPYLKSTIETLTIEHSNKINKVLNFFLDLNQSFLNIAKRMAPNSYSIWTIGNRNVGNKEIPNDLIIRDFLEAKGFFYVTELERKILNKKMPSKNNFSQTMKTEKILIFRKRG
jgi:DNA modification methylase